MSVLDAYSFREERVPRYGYGGIDRGIPRVGYNGSNEKVVIKSMNQDPRVFDMDRIEEEFDLMIECEHKNVLKALDVGTDEHYYTYMVLEYIDCDLMDFFGQDKVYYSISKADKIREILRQILLGLACMHGRGVAHQNVGYYSLLVKRNYDEFVVKLADFSCARRITTPANPEIAGSPEYSAPEVLRMEAERMGTKVDIWSAGVVFLQMLMGYNPFYPGISHQKEREKVVGEIHRFLDEDMFKLIEDKAAVELLKGMLAWDPEERFTAQEALDSPYLAVQTPPVIRENKVVVKVEDRPSTGFWTEIAKIFSLA